MKKEELKELTDERTGPCVSIYMPTVKGSIETKQNPVRYRKLLREAARKLAAAGVKPSEAAALLAPAQPLLQDHMFWQYQSGGLAVFLSRRVRRAYTLPLNFSEMAVVGERFCVKQLLPLFAEDGRFCVLALSQKSVKLYQCSRYSVSEVDLRQAPKGIAELLELNHGEKQLQFHARTEGHAAGRGRAGMFHGRAEDTDETKENILVYFQNVNRAVNSVLSGAGGPLVLAGVDYLTRIYEKANTYPGLCEGRITGNPSEIRPQQLKDRAWKLVKPDFEEGARTAVRRFEQLQGTRMASNHLRTILQAAGEGRVAALFVSSKDQRWGFYDDESGVLDIHAKAEPCDMELLDLCATRTLDHGGQVYSLEPDRMPGKAPTAAIFRY
jgi:hypothetical protein